MRHTLTLLMAALIAVTLLAIPPPAKAQGVCIPRESAIKHLRVEYGERVIGRGLSTNGTLMIELLVSETGTWTVLVTDVNKRSCLVAKGDSWEEIPQTTPGDQS